jgi:hypothetical protein
VRQAVQPRHRRRLDAVGERSVVLRTGGNEEVEEEAGVARGPLHHLVDQMRPQRRRVCRGVRERERLIAGQRLEELADHALPGREVAAVGVAARDGDQTAEVVGARHERAEQLGGLLVHVMDVLDRDQRPGVQPRLQEGEHDGVQPRGAEVGGQLTHLRRGRHVDVERDRQQRQPRHQLRSAHAHRHAQLRDDRVRRLLRAHAEQLAQQLAPGAVWRGGGVRLAGGMQDGPVACEPAQLVEQARLAHPRLARDLDEDAAAARQRTLEGGDLPAPADEREVGDRGHTPARARRMPHRPRADGARLALHHERLQRHGGEARRGPVQD